MIFTEAYLRLQGPLSSNGTGRVEIFFNGEWGTISDYNWNIYDATVVCRQLGYLYAVRSLRTYQVPDGSGRVWLRNVACTGHEQNIANCSHDGWGHSTWWHYYDVGVKCSSTAVGEYFYSYNFCFSDYTNYIFSLKSHLH